MSAKDQKTRPTTQFKNWCGTIFKIGTYDLSTIWLSEKSKDYWANTWTQLCSQYPFIDKGQANLEECPETKRVHFQFALRMKTNMTFNGLKARFSDIGNGALGSMHFEHQKGKWDENLVYTSKKDSQLLGPFRYNIDDPDAPLDRIVEYWFGKPGTGKSTEARTILRSKGYDIFEVCKSDASKGTWLGGYEGQKGCIMDEVEGNWFDVSNWKKVLDRMPQKMAAGAGGKTIDWRPKHIIMISNFWPPDLFFEEAFKSRIDKIRFVDRDPYPMKKTNYEGFHSPAHFTRMAEFVRPSNKIYYSLHPDKVPKKK